MIIPSVNIEYIGMDHFYDIDETDRKKIMVITNEKTELAIYNKIYRFDEEEKIKDFFGEKTKKYVDSIRLMTGIEINIMAIDIDDYDYEISELIHFSFDFMGFTFLSLEKNEAAIRFFLEICLEKKERGELSHIVVNAFENETKDIEIIKEKINKMSESFLDGYFEMGDCLSVVLNQIKDYDSAGVYLGLINSIEIGESPINKRIPVILKKEYNKEEIIKNYNYGLVCFKRTLKKGVVCTSATCATQIEDSANKNISNFLIVQEIVKEIKSLLSEYVGETYNSFIKNEIENEIYAILENKKSEEIIKEFNLDIYPKELIGEVAVEIEIMPIFTVEKIKQYTQVRIRV
jgi:hypothetical protein